MVIYRLDRLRVLRPDRLVVPVVQRTAERLNIVDASGVRKGNDWTDRFPAIVASMLKLKAKSAVIDIKCPHPSLENIAVLLKPFKYDEMIEAVRSILSVTAVRDQVPRVPEM